jgi:hypothetical protein
VTLPEPRWNAPGVVLSGAFVGAWLGGRYSGFQAESASVWATGTLGIDDWGQIGLATAWTQNLADGPNTFSPTLRFRGGFDGARITAEGAWLLDLPPSGELANRYRASLGGEFRIQGGSWVHGSFGLEFDPTDDLVTLLGGLSFRWGQASEPSFLPEPVAASASTTGKALATTFTELIVMNSVFTIEMGDDLILAKPAIELPSGGGVYSSSRTRTLAAAADTANADANNGFPAADGLMYLPERLVFEKNQSFSANLHIYQGSGTAGPLAAIQALTALAGNDSVSIRVRMIGVRGEKLLKGTPRATSAAAR